MTPLWRLDAAQLAAGYCRGDFTPVEALASVVERVREIEALGAIVALDRAAAQRAAMASRQRWRSGAPLGPLDGIPVSVKDNLHVAGMRTTWGSRAFDAIAERDELPVQRLRGAGALLFAKTNLPEFAMQGYTANEVFGLTRNPWNRDLTPGGSSGGAAAAVAAGCGPLALATDGGGSIRRPAGFCGLVGFKPGAGRVARAGGLPEIFLGFEVAGGLGRTVGDVHALVQAAAGEPASALLPMQPARILYVPRFGDNPVEPAIVATTAQAARRFEALGHRVEEATRFELADRVNRAWPTLSAAGLAALQGRPAGFDATQLFEVFAAVHDLERELAALFGQHDFLLTPASATMPWPAAQPYPATIDGREAAPRAHAVYTAFANAAGLPALSIPGERVDGLPAGLHLVARRGEDARLLALAAQYEHAHPWIALAP